jgi:phosphoribosylanthranilate isomerase
MALQTLVKVSSINNLSDARYCAGMGVAMAGFTLDIGTDTYVDPVRFAAITEWISGVQLVGEVASAEASTLELLRQQYTLDYLQADESSDWQALRQLGIPLICRIHWDRYSTAEELIRTFAPIRNFVDWFLLESASDDMPEPTLRQVKQVSEQLPVLLGFGLSPQNVLSILSQTRIGGIALKGSQEIRPGFKDYEDLAQILEQLEDE